MHKVVLKISSLSMIYHFAASVFIDWDFESGTILDRCDHHDAAEEAFVMHGHGRGNAYTANIPRISPVFMFPHFWSERNNGTDFIDWRRRI